ncbi:MAG: bifunctional phosphopantothenoylcysteine decarboxylase/phosphopantothenate--cysteine ligase CoaBC [Bacillota bacterium]|nr:bifunctional phosphopantothenoylcysteine decarboxylase/phosphopantothenate--cysteine ligase CoaBC [Bacillota bacterium]
MAGNNVVLGVTGGIAAYKALDIVSNLRKMGINVYVIMTKNAEEFVSPLSFQSLSHNLVYDDMFEELKEFDINHISLAKKADILLVAPATYNIIGKVASGICDDLLSTTIAASKAPVYFALAMNTNMLNNPILQENINKLKKLGYNFIDPSEGVLACGDTGRGKLADTRLICDVVMSRLYPKKDLRGKNILITAGPTISPIDPVRYITNYSSGKMGYSLAKEARDRGGNVTLVAGPNSLEDIYGINTIKIKTNEDMYEAVKNYIDNCHIYISAAAVADYKAKTYSKEKIKKTGDTLSIDFEKDRDILYEMGKNKKHQIFVGFAAESSNIIENALSKIDRKNLDFIVANDITKEDSGFASDYNSVMIIDKNGNITEVNRDKKSNISAVLFDIISKGA